MKWTLEDQLALVRGSRLAALKYRLHKAVAKVKAERSHARWTKGAQR